MTISIFLIDDHALVRTGFSLILGNEVDMQVVGEADSGEDALPRIRKLKPDVVLCDLHLPGVSGLEITERIVRGGYGSRVVILSVMEDGQLPKRLLQAGASGYVGKGCDAAQLLVAIRTVASGGRYLDPSVAHNIVFSKVDEAGSPFDKLSSRELEVAMLPLQGMRQEDIARRLSLSAKTVNTHKARLFLKMEVQDNIALARLAAQYGVVEPVRVL